MDNNEIMTTEIEETTETENEAAKKIGFVTGCVVVLAAYGTYCLVLEGATAAKKLVKQIKAKRAESVDNDVVEDDIFED